MKAYLQRTILLTLTILYILPLLGQSSFWVSFVDKGDSVEYYLTHPQYYLSTAALERRALQGINIDYSDIPINSCYLTELSKYVEVILAKSKWFNSVVVQVPAEVIPTIKRLPFVLSVKPLVNRSLIQVNDQADLSSIHDLNESSMDSVYGMAYDQIRMIKLDELHKVGFTGKGVRIAVLDGGFKEADNLAAFDSLRGQGRILGMFDFVRNTEDIFTKDVTSSHGARVLSTLAGQLPGMYVGSAPDAQYALAITERPRSERRQEEYNWVEAVEWADSIGVDIIHSSLSYNTFDNPDENYRWSDMDGQHALTTIAADKAVSKGIIVTTGAGNEGNKAWKRITAPCDGDSVLCVGAIDRDGNRAPFSSIGPSADGQVKPDVVAMGQEAAVVGPDGTIIKGNGTSYSSPLIAGLAACLIQAHPTKTAMDIIQAIRLSGHIAFSPDSLLGYGIPSSTKADSLLRFSENLNKVVIPHPSSDPRPKTLRVEKTNQTEMAPTKDHETTLRIIADALTLKTLDNRIRNIKIMKGKQQVFFPKEDIQQSDFRVVYNIERLLPGEYSIFIETDNYREAIPFER